MRTNDEQRHINPIARGREITDALIARHGIIQAVEIGQQVHECLRESLAEQRRRHPEEWPQPAEQKLLTMPRITG